MIRDAAAIAILLVIGTSPIYAQEPVFVVTTTSANVHKAPSTGSAVIGKVRRGMSSRSRARLAHRRRGRIDVGEYSAVHRQR